MRACLAACLVACAAADAPLPSWTADVEPLLDRHCARCHGAGHTIRAGVDVTGFDAASAAAVKNTCVSIAPELIAEGGDALLPLGGDGDAPCSSWEPLSMPPGAVPRLSPWEQRILLDWVLAGTPP